jgi:hypothetical protein
MVLSEWHYAESNHPINVLFVDNSKYEKIYFFFNWLSNNY